MTTTLEKAKRATAGKPVARTIRLAQEDDFRELSYFTLCCIADATMYGNPIKAIPGLGQVWEVDVDNLGNFMKIRQIPQG
jgi:hypothetical protein